MKKTRFPELGANHRRGISTTLAFLDEALGEFEQWARGRETGGALYRERNTLSPAQRKKLLSEIAAMRGVLRELREALALQATTQDAAESIWGRCSALREHLVELTGRHLRRYGTPPPGLAGYLNPKVEELLQRLDRISAVITQDPPDG